VPGCQKLKMTAQPGLAQDALWLYPYGNSGRQRVNQEERKRARDRLWWRRRCVDLQVHVGRVGNSTNDDDTRIFAGVLGADARYRQSADAVTVCGLVVGTQLEEHLVAIPAHLVGRRVCRDDTLECDTLSHLGTLVPQRLTNHIIIELTD